MTPSIRSRKDEHIEWSSHDAAQARTNPFDRLRLPYRALPEISRSNVDTSTTLLGRRLRQPLIIGSMTGGTERADVINENLAIAAQEQGVGLGVGSQRIALERPEVARSFRRVRQLAPSIPLFANVGAVQLNYGLNTQDCLRAVDMIEADALFLHLNALQEAIQPAGDDDFSDLLRKIEAVTSACPVPVFAKEVGHGIDARTARRLIDAGVDGIDVAGVGGTSWAWVEAQRAGRPRTGSWFHDMGVTTTDAIRGLVALPSEVIIIASGGVRSPVDGLKSRHLGAHLYSAARPFLLEASESAAATVLLLQEWEDGLRTAMFATGALRWGDVARFDTCRCADEPS